MKYLVTKKWVVEVSEDDVKRFSARAGRELDPRQIAIYKAIEKMVELLHAQIQDPGSTGEQMAFDVELWEGKN
jgi:hypothetical protein